MVLPAGLSLERTVFVEGRYLCEPQISANDRPKRIPAAAIGRPFNPRIRHKLDQPSLQDLAADRLRSSNPHRWCERRQRLFLNAVSSLGGFRTPASPCLAPPRARGRRPKPFTIAAVRFVLPCARIEPAWGRDG